jgi:hypothetical protein
MNKKPVTRGSRYFDLSGLIHVIIYSGRGIVKLMPLKKNAMVEVWEVEEFYRQIDLLKLTHIQHPPITRINVSEHLMEFQFNILGKTMADTIHETSWKNEWKLTESQKKLFKSYATGVLKKVFRFNTSKARETYNFFNENFGLSVVHD